MFVKISASFTGTRKYFLVTLLLIFGIVTLGIFTPFLIQNQIENFSSERSKFEKKLIDQSDLFFSNVQKKFYEDYQTGKLELSRVLLGSVIDRDTLLEILLSEPLKNYTVEIFDESGQLFSYNQGYPLVHAAPKETEIVPEEIRFHQTALHNYFLLTDTITIGPQNFIMLFALRVSGKLTNTQHDEQFLFDKFIAASGTDARIVYEPSSGKNDRLDTLSVQIRNNKANVIGGILYKLPSSTEAQDTFIDNISILQSLLLLGILLTTVLGIREDFKRIQYHSIKAILVLFFLVFFRWILFSLDIVSILFPTELTNPGYFSSAFGSGIVKSPAEFLITALFLLILAIFYLNYSQKSKPFLDSGRVVSKIIYFLSVILFGFAAALLLRGYAASMRSVIFDSSLSYFKDPSLFPSLPAFIMNLGVFLLGGGIFLILLSAANLLLRNYTLSGLKGGKSKYVILFTPFISAIIYLLYFTPNPVVTLPLSLTFMALFGILVLYFQNSEINTANLQILSLLLASVLSVSFMNYFNSELTKEELKTAAHEHNRKNPGLFKFLLTDAMETIPAFIQASGNLHPQKSNLDAEAYFYWSTHAISKELYASGIYFLDNRKNILGGFGYNLDNIERIPVILKYLEISTPSIFSFSPQRNNKNIIQLVGLAPIFSQEKEIAYVAICLLYDASQIHKKSDFPLLKNAGTKWRSTLESENLNILNFRNALLVYTEGEFYPDKRLTSAVLDSSFSQAGEKWINYSLGDEEYIFYSILNQVTEDTYITATGIKVRTFAWNLFNFFKLFLIHSVFSLLFYAGIFVVSLKNNIYPKYTFRAQLLVAFLLISIIPIIALAVYNRINITRKAEEGIRNLIDQKTTIVLNYLQNAENKFAPKTEITGFENAFIDLRIHFSVYRENILRYTSIEQLESAQIMPERLEADLLKTLYQEGLRDDFRTVNYGGSASISHFKRFTINGKDYVLEVNSLLNNVKPVLLPVEIDIILFGVYSLAILLIIIVSSFMANRISMPIKKLTRATHSVAGGDYNYDIPVNVKGELKELLNGFENMTNELKRNQSELSSLEREAAWKEMARQVAHEIKNPLTPMKLTIQHLIHAYKSGAKNFDVIFDKVSSTIINQIEVLNQIASEFSRFARMPGMNADVINPIEIIEDTVNLYNDEKVTFRIEHKILNVAILLDKSQFRRMMVNLIRNSIQAGASEIEISTSEEYNSFIILFNDNGKGVPEEIREMIYKDGFTTKSGGMGLGLSMTKRLIENAGGSIVLASSATGRTSFKIMIPVESGKIMPGDKPIE